MSNPLFYPAVRREHRKRKVVGPSGPVVVTAVSVTAVSGGEGRIVFESTGGTGPAIITAVNDVSNLEIEFEGDWLPCDVISDFGADWIQLENPTAIVPGRAWRVLTPMDVVWNDDPSIVMNVPANGVVL